MSRHYITHYIKCSAKALEISANLLSTAQSASIQIVEALYEQAVRKRYGLSKYRLDAQRRFKEVGGGSERD